MRRFPAAQWILAACCFLIAASGASAAIIVVNDPTDTLHSPGCATTGLGNCSLRDAITFANSNAGPDTINFNIAGAGVQTLAPTSALPTVTGQTTIDGYTQPGSSMSTNPITQGSNAVLLIELNLTNNLGSGLVLGGAGSNTVRGLVINRSPGPGLSVTSLNNIVAGNFIGTNPAGSAAGAGNAGDGIFVSSNNNVIGGTAAGDRNLISANAVGIRISSGTNHIIQGNLIGTSATGTVALGNVGQGVVSGGSLNFVGGAVVGAPPEVRNIISGNGAEGVLVTGSLTFVRGNYIGTDVTGAVAIANNMGIVIGGPTNNVGGGGNGDGNLISGNTLNGINITNQSPGGATVRGNFVGTNAAGTAAIPGHSIAGINIGPFSNLNTIGDTSGQPNIVAFNTGVGIFVAGAGATGGTGNFIHSNSIHSNAGGLGIKLGTPSNGAPTPNDAGDADTGPNNLQNFPLITAASIAGTSLTVSATLNSNPNTTYQLFFSTNAACDPSGNGEGQTPLPFSSFSDTVTTDGSGNATFGPRNFDPVPVPGQNVITATARNTATGDSSEFSPCFTATGGLPTISVNDVTQAEGNAGLTNFVFTVSISSTANASVQFGTADGTATAGSDYASTSGMVTFTSGGPLTQIVTVQVSGDTTVEPDETFFVNLATPVGATIADAQGLGTIVNDDVVGPTLTINDVSQAEGNAGTTNFVFTVTISSTANATVNFATADGSATAGSDYVANSGTVTFTSGGPVTQTITVQVNGDATVEPNETFVVNLSGAAGATIADAQGIGTIVNDDAGVPTLAISDASVFEGNTGTVNLVFTVSISAPPAANVTVNYATADNTATAGSDYVAASGTLTFTPAGPLTQTITVLINGDAVIEGTETFFVNLSGAAGATVGDGQGVGSIVDDDAPPSTADIPTLGEWQLIALMLLLAALGWHGMRRRGR